MTTKLSTRTASCDNCEQEVMENILAKMLNDHATAIEQLQKENEELKSRIVSIELDIHGSAFPFKPRTK